MIGLALGLLAPPALPTMLAAEPGPGVSVRVDSARHTVAITSGPHRLEGSSPPMAASAMGPMHAHGTSEPFRRFAWPVDGWMRGVRLTITDGAGRELSRRLVHHVNVVNLERRMLLYAVPERVIALGQETEDISLPASIGVPMRAGTEMGLVLMWHNSSDTTFEGVTMTLTIDWSPTNLYPRPLDVLPVYMDVADPVGRPVDFDLPPGEQRFPAEFEMPIDGRIIGVGGHLHDYGTGLVLEDITDGQSRRVVELGTTLDPDRRIIAVERKYPGIRGRGIKLAQGRSYRLTGGYDNTSGRLLVDGAMAHLIMLFAPDDPGDWPPADPEGRDWRADLAELERTPSSSPPAAHQHP